jgi:hypothetical protein
MFFTILKPEYNIYERNFPAGRTSARTMYTDIDAIEDLTLHKSSDSLTDNFSVEDWKL